MSKIVIGDDVRLDLDILLRSRLLIQANSGGGKSWCIRRIAEQAFGKIPVIILDPEGEFATLREKYGYVLVGKGGETPADVRSAEVVAHRLLEVNASAVCDIFEMPPFERHRWVRTFINALIDAPKELWKPALVIVDEAHTYCPEKGAGESEASEAMISLATRGRKRGFCAVFATQRISKLRKDAAAELHNNLIGKCFIDADRKRAAEQLGVQSKDFHDFSEKMKMLPPGVFLAQGVAISTEIVQVKVGSVETTHPDITKAKKQTLTPPPAPQAIKHLLPKLADLPKEAEEKAKTVADFQKEIRSLKAQLSSKPRAEIDEASVQKLVEKAVTQRDREHKQQLAGYQTVIERLQSSLARIGKEAGQHVSIELPKERHAVATIELPPRRAASVPRPPPTIRRAATPAATSTGEPLAKGERAVLIAVAQYPNGIAKESLTVFTGYKRSTRDAYIQRLREKGYVEDSNGLVIGTDEGIAALGSDYEPLPTGDELREHWLGRLPEGERRVLEVLLAHYPKPVARESIGELTGYKRSTRDAYLQRLDSRRLVEQVGRGEVKAAEDLFN